jgi:hypothetical protein
MQAVLTVTAGKSDLPTATSTAQALARTESIQEFRPSSAVQGLDVICFRDDVDLVRRNYSSYSDYVRDIAYFFKTQGNDVTQVG